MSVAVIVALLLLPAAIASGLVAAVFARGRRGGRGRGGGGRAVAVAVAASVALMLSVRLHLLLGRIYLLEPNPFLIN